MSPTQEGANGLETELDALYTAPLDQFVARRDALAKSLKEAGAADDSRRVKALRKPSVVAWGINRLHLEQGGLAEIAAASDVLRAALRHPRSAEERRGAIEARRRALEGATSAVVALIEETGAAVSPALLRRIERTVLAVSTGGGDDQPAPGRLDQELEPPGFEAIFEGPAPVPPTPPSKPAPKEPPAKPVATSAAKPAAKGQTQPAVEKAPAAKTVKPATTAKTAPPQRSNVRDFQQEAAVRKAQAALDDAEGELERATDTVEAGRMRVTDAEKALVVARKEVDAARRELAAVRSRRDEARRELDRAKKERDG